MMKNKFTVLLITACIAALASGCSQGGSYLDRMATLEKQSCVCADTPCAEKAFKDFLTIARDMKKEDAKFGEEDTKKLGMNTAAIVRCIMMKGVSPVSVQQELQKLKN
jgi:hypothetical protein